MKNLIIDADGCTMGRLASYAAKKALEGEEVIIFNSEKAIISGNRESIIADYKRKYEAKSQVNPRRIGPKRPKNPDRFLRRAIRGMLPWDTDRGRSAFKRVMVYIGRPEGEIMKRHHIDLSKAGLADVSKLKKHYDLFTNVGDVCRYLGGTNG
jgi:large subunit ribosomal protein L13